MLQELQYDGKDDRLNYYTGFVCQKKRGGFSEIIVFVFSFSYLDKVVNQLCKVSTKIPS